MIESTVSREHIERRLDDWAYRITNLYSSIKKWLEPISLYETKERNDVIMYEELMQKNDIPKRTLSSLDIYHKGTIVATVKPVGLWIIGANGRVDILLKNGAVMLLDVSDSFENPRWIAYSKPKTSKGSDFCKEYFLDILGVN